MAAWFLCGRFPVGLVHYVQPKSLQLPAYRNSLGGVAGGTGTRPSMCDQGLRAET